MHKDITKLQGLTGNLVHTQIIICTEKKNYATYRLKEAKISVKTAGLNFNLAENSVTDLDCSNIL